MGFEMSFKDLHSTTRSDVRG